MGNEVRKTTPYRLVDVVSVGGRDVKQPGLLKWGVAWCGEKP